jgi:hypothetical protein
MSEPSYGSGQSYDPQQQGYGGGSTSYGQAYGGQPPPAPHAPYGTGQQPAQQYGGYGQPGQQGPQGQGGYPSGGYPSTQVPTPSPPRRPADRLGMAGNIVTIIGYVCAGAGLLGFILWLTVDGDTTRKFATALQALVLGLGLGGVNYAVGTWLERQSRA